MKSVLIVRTQPKILTHFSCKQSNLITLDEWRNEGDKRGNKRSSMKPEHTLRFMDTFVVTVIIITHILLSDYYLMNEQNQPLTRSRRYVFSEFLCWVLFHRWSSLAVSRAYDKCGVMRVYIRPYNTADDCAKQVATSTHGALILLSISPFNRSILMATEYLMMFSLISSLAACHLSIDMLYLKFLTFSLYSTFW